MECNITKSIGAKSGQTRVASVTGHTRKWYIVNFFPIPAALALFSLNPRSGAFEVLRDSSVQPTPDRLWRRAMLHRPHRKDPA